MLAYHWGWRQAAAASAVAIFCVYYLFIAPYVALKPLAGRALEQVLTLAIVTSFVLILVQLARTRRAEAEREASRFAALNTVGTALSSELDEQRLLRLIASTACELSAAEFAAFTLRPLDELGRPAVPAEGNLFHLAAIVGVTPEQEALFRRMPLGGEGLLAPIFRHGVPVRVADALEFAGEFQSGAPAHHGNGSSVEDAQEPNQGSGHARGLAREAAAAYAQGLAAKETLHSLGVPRGHPLVRSFLGAPLLDREGEVRGGLLLGHSLPGRFTAEDESLLVGLAAQAAVALDNARLYRAAQTRAQELDAIFESIADGVTLLDEHGQVVRENAAAHRLREATLASGTKPDAFSSIVNSSALLALHGGPAAAEGPLPGVPITVADRRGEVRNYLVSASPLRAGEAAPGVPGDRAGGTTLSPGAVVVCHDVTESRRLEEERRARAELEARRALLQTVIDQLPSGVYLARGDDARLVLANRAAETVFGAEWPHGMPMAEFLASRGVRVVGPSGVSLRPEELATVRALRTGQAIRHQQEVIRQPGGTPLPVLLNAVALDATLVSWPEDGPAERMKATRGTTDGRVEPGALVVLQDVSALKEAERLKDEFIAIAAHELRNPMAAIKGYAQMLTGRRARGAGQELAEWQLEALETIDSSTTRLVELTDDLLDVTRLQAGRLELRQAPIDLVALARRVAKRLQITAPAHTLEVSADSDAVVANVDAQRIEQVLGNLLNNAIKYSPDGGAIAIAVHACVERGVAEVSIRDQGIGIPVAQQARMFSRFARADNARQRGIGGTGLGLYLCRELVERHGGRIWFESVEGQGTMFYVNLPLAAEIDGGTLAEEH